MWYYKKKTIMKNIKHIVILVFIFIPSFVMAQGSVFSVSLGYGSTEKNEVIKLQQFLVSEGFLGTNPTGSYLSLTVNAVKAFQKSQNIQATGYFGPLTRAAAHQKFTERSTPQSSVSVSSVSSNKSLAAAVFLSSSKKVEWNTANYPVNVGVNINLLKKVNTSPVTYEFVRHIAKDTPNDGQEVWTPTSAEKNLDLYIEVTCSTTYTFTKGCQISRDPIKVQ